MDKSQALRKLKENGTTFESFTGGYLMQIGKQIQVFEDGQKAPKVLTQAQQNKLLQMPTVIKQQDDNRRFSANQLDERLMYQDDEEEVVKTTFLAHPNLEVLKFAIDCVWRVTTLRKRGDDFILNSDN
ncbi:MAG: hypothetical protein EZS28_028200, partial [Streblomastix strix]